MEESDLRVLIQKLTKELLPRFESDVTDPEARIELVLDKPELNLLTITTASTTTSWPRKNEEVAKQNREDGNNAFTSGNHELAITLYTEAMKYAQVHETLWEGETMAIAAANRSACYFTLKQYQACLTDIALALEAGYPTHMIYKLYIRKCKCLLELCRIPDAQEAFDKAIDAIDRSGLKKDLRKDMVADLQGAFISLAKSVEEDPPNDDIENSEAPVDLSVDQWIRKWTRNKQFTMPEWSHLKEPNPYYPSCTSALTIKYDPAFGRHVVANRDIEVGEVLFNEEPIVHYLNIADEDVVATPACHYCLMYIRSALVPCPTCSSASYCSIKCRNEALNSHHKFECRIASSLERTQLNKLPLVMASIRAITQRPVEYFVQEAAQGAFDQHDVQNGVDPSRVYRSDDYRNLFNLVTHTHRRAPLDVGTKYIIAGILVRFLKAAGYFEKDDSKSSEILIGKLLAHFLQCIQFNMHMVESGFSNRLICLDSETRIWKFADKFCIGEFIETTPLGGAVYPTLANVNHSCDPNFTIVNYGRRAVAVATRRIKTGMEVHDSYGAVWYHMDRTERQRFLKNSYWFDCNCNACANNFPSLQKLPRDYLKLSGTHFKYKRCNRKELQKDVDKLKKRIRATILDEKIPVTLEVPNHYEATRKMFHDWMNLLDELLVPASHQDFVTVSRGIRNCMWLQSPNIVKVKETDVLKETKAKHRQSTVSTKPTQPVKVHGNK